MKSSTDPQAPKQLIQPCEHLGSAIFSDSEFCCPADRAIRCANDILDNLSDLNTLEDQTARFSLILQSQLTSLLKKPVRCFWSLNEKLSTEELERAERASHAQDEGIEFQKPRHQNLNQSIVTLNQNYDSVGFLEVLIQIGIGTSHVFGLESMAEGTMFVAYPRDGRTDRGTVFEYLLPYPCAGSIENYLDKCTDHTEATAVQHITTYLEAWKEAAATFREALIDFSQCRHQKSQITLALPSVKEACSHMALICLYAANNGFSNVSYVLAPTLRGTAHSSMVVFWPAFPEGAKPDARMTFLLHLILGINAIRARSVEEKQHTEEAMSGILLHDMDNLEISVDSIYEQAMRDWDDCDDSKKKEYFDSMRSTMLLNSSAKILGISQSLGSSPHHRYIAVSQLHNELYTATRFHDFEVIFEDQDKWRGCSSEINNSAKTILSNLIGNARKASVFNKRVALSVRENTSDCTFKVKSQEPIPETIVRILQEPKSPRMPVDKKGLWICRTLLERCGGELRLGQPAGEYKTVFEVIMPWKR